MQSFNYVVTSAVGLHARIAGSLMRLVKNFKSDVIFQVGDTSSNLQKVLEMMNMPIQCGDQIQVAVQGADEVVACDEIKHFLQENL
jgi:phosphocarrier protein